MTKKIWFSGGLILLMLLSGCKKDQIILIPKESEPPKNNQPEKKPAKNNNQTEEKTEFTKQSKTYIPKIDRSAKIKEEPKTFTPKEPVRQVRSVNYQATPRISYETDNGFLISKKGIGLAKLGMRFSELKKKLGNKFQWRVEKNLLVDFDGIAITKDGEVQYYILYAAGTTFKDKDRIKTLLTYHPLYKTNEGVGVGTLIADAAEIYGQAKLSYNLDNEGREYVKFAKQPTSMSFRTGSYGDGSLSGIYAEKSGQFNETKKYKEDGKIESVEVN
ncbi:MAG TPA: hypothetical protein V6C58_06235 [Allocoleopsis sp.]